MYKGYIYRHWHVNEDDVKKSYVGQVYNKTPQRRWGRNGKGYTEARKKDGNLTEFANAINKYGWDNFNHDILLIIECETLEELVFWLDAWEKYYIEKYDSFYNGYNGTTGGRNGYVFSEESIQKIREATKQQFANMSEEEKKQIREKQSEAQKQGRANMSEEEKRQWSEATKQTWANKSEEEKRQWSEKCSEATKQRHANMSDEEKKQIREKQSETKKGDKNPMATKVICLETQQVFITIKEAQEWVGKGNIYNYLGGNSKYAGKHPITGERLHWMYYSDYLEQQNKENSDTNNN